MQTIRFSAALAASLALLIGFGSIAYGQVGGNPGVGGPGFVGPAAGGQPQPGNYGPPQTGLPPTAPVTAGGQVPSGHGVGGIGVIDVRFLFMNYEKFERQMQGIKGKVETAESEVQKEATQIKAMGEQIRAFGPDKPEARKLEQDMMRRQSELQIRIATQKRQILEDENRVYYTTGKELDDAVRIVANRFNLNIVFRITVEDPNPNNRSEIALGLNKFIVYHHPQMDITPHVLNELKRAERAGGVLGPPGSNPGMSQRPVPTQR